MFVIGLTGGIGTGKSEVSRILRGFGAEIIDTDQIGHEVYLPGTAGFREVVKNFGDEVVADNGTIDRHKLGAIVFDDPQRLSLLNAIDHPQIQERVDSKLIAAENLGVQVTVVESALLLDSYSLRETWANKINEVWLVTAQQKTAISRVQRRTGLDKEAIHARIRSQITDDGRLKYADGVIDNNGTLGELRKTVSVLWKKRVPQSP